MKEINDYAARLSIPLRDLDDAKDYICDRIARMEKDAIYQAVKQTEPGNWILIKPETFEERNYEFNSMDYYVRVNCRSVETRQVYIPVYSQTKFPSDTLFCEWCGGWTKNDMRGHCGACGAPRNEKYLDLERP